VISLVLFGLVSLLERILVPWAPRRSRRELTHRSCVRRRRTTAGNRAQPLRTTGRTGASERKDSTALMPPALPCAGDGPGGLPAAAPTHRPQAGVAPHRPPSPPPSRWNWTGCPIPTTWRCTTRRTRGSSAATS
jgi:hypothetical protein